VLENKEAVQGWTAFLLLNLSSPPPPAFSRRAELALHLLANLKLFTPLSDVEVHQPQELLLFSISREEQAFAQLLTEPREIP